jgi:hypothetical protein
MKLLFTDGNLNYLNAMKSRLEQNGIPAYISNTEAARNIPFVSSQQGLWVYLDEQYNDAISLLNDPEHIVQSGIDIDEFYEVANELKQDKSSLNNALGDIFVRGLILLAGMFLFIKLFDAYYAT